MSNSLLQVFEGSEIRIVKKDGGEFWWVAADVCKAIEIDNTSKALERLEDDEKAGITISNIRSANGTEQGREMLCVSEPGLYSLIFSSRKAAAKRFKRWVLHEVLPTIRKTGSYSIAPQPVQPAQQLAPQRDLKDWVECMAIMGLTEDPILKALVSQRMAEQIGGTAPASALPKCLTVLAGELGISQSAIGTGAQLGKYIVAMGFEPVGKTQHGKYLVNAYDRTSELDRAILEYFDAEPIVALGGSTNA